MLLAIDLGGTKTLLGLYARGPQRPTPIADSVFATSKYRGLHEIVSAFLVAQHVNPAKVDATVIGAAGPVRGDEVQLTNVPWLVHTRTLAEQSGLSRVVLLNDVEAMAHSIDALTPDERVELQAGQRDPQGTQVLIAIGTGVGMAIVHRCGHTPSVIASEGGHADFASRTEREIALLRALRPKFGRVDIERVLAGPGIANIARFTHGGACRLFPEGLAPEDEPARVTTAGLDGSCLACREALDIFVEVLGGTAGNLGLIAKATGGVIIGGGIPPKVLPALQSERFLSAFGAKSPLNELLDAMPVSVITMSEAGLLGAAVYANRL